MNKFYEALGAAAVIFIVVLLVALLLAFPTMWAWNYVMPYLFGLKHIGILQAWAVNFLAAKFFNHSTPSKS